MGAKPLNSLQRYVESHLDQRGRLLRYLVSGRGRHAVDEEAFECLLDRSARSLKATNAQARIAITRGLDQSMRDAFDGMDDPVFWISLAPSRFACPLADAPRFDHKALVDWTSELLSTASFVAAVDAGYYSNRGHRSGGRDGVVSWHVHALVWGISERELERRFDTVEDAERSLVAGRRVSHLRRYTAQKARQQKLPYALKAPMKDYRIYDKAGKLYDPRIGSYATVFTGEERQKKRDLRTGDVWQMCRAMGGRTIPDLVFAGAEGKEIVRRGFDLAISSIEARDADRENLQASFLRAEKSYSQSRNRRRTFC